MQKGNDDEATAALVMATAALLMELEKRIPDAVAATAALCYARDRIRETGGFDGLAIGVMQGPAGQTVPPGSKVH